MTFTPSPHAFGAWAADGEPLVALEEGLVRLDRPLYVLDGPAGRCYASGGRVVETGGPADRNALRAAALAPPCLPWQLGDPGFCADHGLIYPCYSGSMAHGIASQALVHAMATVGMLGFYGSAGLSLNELATTLHRLSDRLDGLPFGVNLLYNPHDSAWEQGLVALLLDAEIHLIEASAYLTPTPALVKYRVKGVHKDRSGQVVAPNHVIAKVSRLEVAQRFLAPPPDKILKRLVETNEISADEARLAECIPLAQDITVESDSGGHTDHRPALALLPSMLRLRDAAQKAYPYSCRLRVGLGGGIGAPEAAAAAFAMGAAYIVLGSVCQACTESGVSPAVRTLLAKAAQTDVADAPAADMFEMGVKVQVLKRGTRFAERAQKLYAAYRAYESLDAIPAEERLNLEKTLFQAPLETIWEQTRSFFEQRDPRQLEKAATNPRHKMALLFRWYLGNAVYWAIQGLEQRKDDFQIWCGPSMGAFNDWARGSFLEAPEARSAPLIAVNLLFAAAVALRVQCLRAQGVDISLDSVWTRPRETFPPFMPQRTRKESS